MLFISALPLSLREISWSVGWKHWEKVQLFFSPTHIQQEAGRETGESPTEGWDREQRSGESLPPPVWSSPLTPPPPLSHDTVLSGLGGVIVKRCIHAVRPRPCPPSSQGEVFLFTSLTSPSALLHSVLQKTTACSGVFNQPALLRPLQQPQCIAGGRGYTGYLSAHKLSRTLAQFFFPPPSRACTQLQLRRKTIALPFRPAGHQLRPPPPTLSASDWFISSANRLSRLWVSTQSHAGAGGAEQLLIHTF